MKAIIDTCIIVDVLQARTPFCVDAQKLFLLAANRQFTGCLTAKSITDIYYLTHRLTHSDNETRKILNKLFSLFTIVDTTGKDCLHAVSSRISDYEDAVMTETAKRIEADCIITRNINDYKYADIPIMAANDFVKALESEEK